MPSPRPRIRPVSFWPFRPCRCRPGAPARRRVPSSLPAQVPLPSVRRSDDVPVTSGDGASKFWWQETPAAPAPGASVAAPTSDAPPKTTATQRVAANIAAENKGPSVERALKELERLAEDNPDLRDALASIQRGPDGAVTSVRFAARKPRSERGTPQPRPSPREPSSTSPRNARRTRWASADDREDVPARARARRRRKRRRARARDPSPRPGADPRARPGRRRRLRRPPPDATPNARPRVTPRASSIPRPRPRRRPIPRFLPRSIPAARTARRRTPRWRVRSCPALDARVRPRAPNRPCASRIDRLGTPPPRRHPHATDRGPRPGLDPPVAARARRPDRDRPGVVRLALDPNPPGGRGRASRRPRGTTANLSGASCETAPRPRVPRVPTPRRL